MKHTFWMVPLVLLALLAAGCARTNPDPPPPPDENQPISQDPDSSLAWSPEQPAGVIYRCEAVGEGRYLLLYQDLLYTSQDPSQPPEYRDTLCLYEPETGLFAPLAEEEHLFHGYDDQMILTDDALLYNSGGIRLLSFAWDGQTLVKTDRTKDPYDYCSVSPDGERYALRRDEVVEIFSMKDDRKLAELPGALNVGRICWSPSGAWLAMVENGLITLWCPGEGTVRRLSEEELGVPEGWVDIFGIFFVNGDRFLVVDYMTETGGALCLWDMERGERLLCMEEEGDITVLDIRGSMVLYEVAPRKGGPHTLEIADFRAMDLETRTVDTHVQQVRKKLGLQGRLVAVPTYGYKLLKI